MTTIYILIFVSHLSASVHFPLHLAFVDILHFAKIQPGQLHPNANGIDFSLIVLCRRLGVEMTLHIVRLYFTPLRQVVSTISLRIRKNKILLFDAPANKVDWSKKWVVFESKVGFSFNPLIGEKHIWKELSPIKHYPLM